MSVEPKKINLRTYNKVWKIENRIYAIQNIVLPVPVSPREVLYFFVIAFIILIISNIVHPIKINLSRVCGDDPIVGGVK